MKFFPLSILLFICLVVPTAIKASPQGHAVSADSAGDHRPAIKKKNQNAEELLTLDDQSMEVIKFAFDPKRSKVIESSLGEAQVRQLRFWRAFMNPKFSWAEISEIGLGGLEWNDLEKAYSSYFKSKKVGTGTLLNDLLIKSGSDLSVPILDQNLLKFIIVIQRFTDGEDRESANRIISSQLINNRAATRRLIEELKID